MLLFLLSACAEKSLSYNEEDSAVENVVMDNAIYQFFDTEGLSSVAYSGQTARQLLISDIKTTISELDQRILTAVLPPTQVESELLFYFDSVADLGTDVEHQFSANIPISQKTYGDVSSNKNLAAKLAGNDSVTDHKDWQQDFVGWSIDDESVTPQELIEHWFQQLDQQATNWTEPLNSTMGEPLEHVYLTPEGQDLQQLIEKFLHGALSFSQATDDYLDDDIEGKGLLSSHILEDGERYSALEHAWDEAFGYFGASQNYRQWSDQEITEFRYQDINQDGEIDLKTEVNWGISINAGKRDQQQLGTDFTKTMWEAFWLGRQLLSQTAGQELSEEEFSELQNYRDTIVLEWEKILAATSIHYMNQLIVDLEQLETDSFNFTNTAKHWSELKGFALAFQFNPRSMVSEGDFVEIHNLIERKPDFQNSSAYIEQIRTARSILANCFDFGLEQEEAENAW